MNFDRIQRPLGLLLLLCGAAHALWIAGVIFGPYSPVPSGRVRGAVFLITACWMFGRRCLRQE